MCTPDLCCSQPDCEILGEKLSPAGSAPGLHLELSRDAERVLKALRYNLPGPEPMPNDVVRGLAVRAGVSDRTFLRGLRDLRTAVDYAKLVRNGGVL